MTRRVRSVLLCEDLQHERLLRPVLARVFGKTPRVERAGGSAFVLKAFPRELDYVRQHPSEAVALVVVVDADAKGFRARLEEITSVGGLKDEALMKQVACCVPTRNVETWILWLCGNEIVDEISDYKKQVAHQADRGASMATRAAKEWLKNEPQRRLAEKSRLPALTHARAEIDRLSQLTKG